MNGHAEESMSNTAFGLLLAGSVATALFGGYGIVFLATREEGRHRSWHWRVHLADIGRAWAVQVMPPEGGPWQTLGAIPRQEGRAAAVELALGTIEAEQARRAAAVQT